jgi:hypothetical protein
VHVLQKALPGLVACCCLDSSQGKVKGQLHLGNIEGHQKCDGGVAKGSMG